MRDNKLLSATSAPRGKRLRSLKEQDLSIIAEIPGVSSGPSSEDAQSVEASPVVQSREVPEVPIRPIPTIEIGPSSFGVLLDYRIALGPVVVKREALADSADRVTYRNVMP